MTKFWTEIEVSKLRELSTAGQSIHDMADQLGRNTDSIRCKLRHLKLSGYAPQQQPTPEVSAALPEFAKAAGVIRQPQKPQVISSWTDDETIGEVWERAEQVNARHIEKSKNRSIFSVDFPGNEPIAVTFISDQHIAPGTPVDMARMRADAEYIRDQRNMFALLMGDGVDNHIKHRAAMMAARTQPSDQYALFEYYLGIFAEKILALCSGNHDAWTDQIGGVDMMQWIAQRQKLCYSPAAFFIEVNVGGQKYNIAARHQYRYNSSFNQTHSVKQLLRLGEVDFDIGGIGHHHEAAVESGFHRGIERWFCRPGSYQISSAYSRQFGYNSAYPTCPTFVLYPGRRDIVGFSDLRKAGQYLRGMLS